VGAISGTLFTFPMAGSTLHKFDSMFQALFALILSNFEVHCLCSLQSGLLSSFVVYFLSMFFCGSVWCFLIVVRSNFVVHCDMRCCETLEFVSKGCGFFDLKF
jgi:hypothetical protein